MTDTDGNGWEELGCRDWWIARWAACGYDRLQVFVC